MRAGTRRSFRRGSDRIGASGVGLGRVSLIGSAVGTLVFPANGGQQPVPLPAGTEIGDLLLAVSASISTQHPSAGSFDMNDSSYLSSTGVAISCGASIRRAGAAPVFTTNAAGTFGVVVFALRGLAALVVDAEAGATRLLSPRAASLRRSLFAVHALVRNQQTPVSVASADVVSLGRIAGPQSVTFDVFKAENIEAGGDFARDFTYGTGTPPNDRAVACFSLVGVQEALL